MEMLKSEAHMVGWLVLRLVVIGVTMTVVVVVMMVEIQNRNIT